MAKVGTGTCQFGNSRDRYRSVITGQTFTGQCDNSRYTYILVVTVETGLCQYCNSIDWHMRAY